MGNVVNMKMKTCKAMSTRAQQILYNTVQQMHLLGFHMGALKHALMRTVKNMLSKEHLYTDAGECGAAAVVTCRNHL